MHFGIQKRTFKIIKSWVRLLVYGVFRKRGNVVLFTKSCLMLPVRYQIIEHSSYHILLFRKYVNNFWNVNRNWNILLSFYRVTHIQVLLINNQRRDQDGNIKNVFWNHINSIISGTKKTLGLGKVWVFYRNIFGKCCTSVLLVFWTVVWLMFPIISTSNMWIRSTVNIGNAAGTGLKVICACAFSLRQFCFWQKDKVEFYNQIHYK